MDDNIQLTDAEKKYFALYEELFEHPGWAQLVKEFITPEIDRLPEVAFSQAKNFPELVEARGKHKAYREFAAIPEMIRQSMESILEENLWKSENEQANHL